jgi:hypothetical protein
MQAALSWFMLGLAAGFLACAASSFLLGGLFGYAYLVAGGLSACASFVVAMGGVRLHRQGVGPEGNETR